jgi:hypothetical protein
MKTIEQMFADVDSTVANYRSDLDIDKKLIADNPGIPFLHCARENGSYIFMLYPSNHESFPAHGETTPYLFGHASRYHIAGSTVATIEYTTTQHEHEKWHYYNGCHVRKINTDTARTIAQAWYNKILREWNRR